MKNFSSLRYRSLLARGAKAIAITSVLLTMVSCSRNKTDTGDFSGRKEELTCTTAIPTTETTMIETSTVKTTTVPTTTTTTETTLMTTQITIPTTTAETEPVKTIVVSNNLPITDQEFILLANVISHEAGSAWISEYERSCIVACVMNRVYDSRYPNSIDEVVHQQGQMFDVPYYRVDYSGIGYESIDNAIYAYFNGTYSCGNINSWSGNGTNNNFYYQ